MPNSFSKRYILSYILLLIFFTGCAQKIEQKPEISKANLQKASWEDLDGYESDDLNLALDVFKKDCAGSKKYKNLKNVCHLSKNKQDANKFFKTNFTPYKLISDDNKDSGLITGYYEPLLFGSLTKTEKYQHPIYATPKDLLTIDLSKVYPELKKYRLRGKLVGNRIIAYETREELEQGKNKNLEPICYVDDKIDLFFLQIQGSGKVQLENGTILNIGYGQQNGRKYYSIGRKLIELGIIDKKDISLQTIKRWLKENPNKIDEILNLNNSYIFFRNSEKSATGSLGIELVANRNLAVDRSYIPLGFPVFINTTNPINNKEINQLMVAADTGGAIKGEIRADFFFGNGKMAEELAGKMKQTGKLYIFIPNNLPKNINKKEEED
ncbi:MAG: MltA domain-containing protein [Campylobacterota bacterium]|nr:MltA domain-containing protein [Campylobacterota bacterium]